jgi:hypothetical protein
MLGWSISKSLLAVSIVSVAAGAALPARAGSTGNGAAGTGFPQYTYEADANRLCKGDTVVWGSSAHKGIYYVKGAGPQRIGGFYACKADVKKAGYKIAE